LRRRVQHGRASRHFGVTNDGKALQHLKQAGAAGEEVTPLTGAKLGEILAPLGAGNGAHRIGFPIRRQLGRIAERPSSDWSRCTGKSDSRPSRLNPLEAAFEQIDSSLSELTGQSF
jgi:hypothetical protein